MLNKVAEKLTGLTIKEAEGRHYKEVFILSHENEELTIDDPIEGVVIIGAIQELDNNAMLAPEDGNKCLLEYSTATTKNITIGIVLVFRDVTEKIKKKKILIFL